MRVLIVASVIALTIVPTMSHAQSCRELQRACQMKDQLGEVGEGNCQRFREQCGGGRSDRCARLRDACMHKDELGETGQGNCQRYRNECRSGGRF